ncbi:tetraspanin-33-like [Dermacentor andersoni]|uniref:tetraspanin-33-like n=1 Tax=Dermacentor andersoni TaxID=34620 RepID=UPI002155A2BF|nr:tetraspanin-33-like [Dermacentor andersoni]
MAKAASNSRQTTATLTTATPQETQPTTQRTETAAFQKQSEVEHSLSTTTRLHSELRIRGIIVGVNLVVVLLSLVALWCATYSYLVRPSSERDDLLNSLMRKSFLFTFFMHLDVFVVVVSVSLSAVAICGLVGALRENIAVLEAYQSLLAVIILVNSITAIAAALGPQSARDHLKDSAYVEFVQGYRQSEHFQHLIDTLQRSMHCCGFSRDSFRDWDRSEYFHCAMGNPSRERCSVPFSCCRRRVLDVNDSSNLPVLARRFCGHGVLLMDDQEAWQRVYTRSCADAALTYVMDNLVTFVGAGMAFNMFLLFMLITSVVLQDQIQTISAISEAYYDTLNEGQEAMQEAGLIKFPKKPRNKPTDKSPDKANDKVAE